MCVGVTSIVRKKENRDSKWYPTVLYPLHLMKCAETQDSKL